MTKPTPTFAEIYEQLQMAWDLYQSKPDSDPAIERLHSALLLLTEKLDDLYANHVFLPK